MIRANQYSDANPSRRPLAIAALILFAAGCTGEPAPLRAKDPERAREAFQKKMDRPDEQTDPKRP